MADRLKEVHTLDLAENVLALLKEYVGHRLIKVFNLPPFSIYSSNNDSQNAESEVSFHFNPSISDTVLNMNILYDALARSNKLHNWNMSIEYYPEYNQQIVVYMSKKDLLAFWNECTKRGTFNELFLRHSVADFNLEFKEYDKINYLYGNTYSKKYKYKSDIITQDDRFIICGLKSLFITEYRNYGYADPYVCPMISKIKDKYICYIRIVSSDLQDRLKGLLDRKEALLKDKYNFIPVDRYKLGRNAIVQFEVSKEEAEVAITLRKLVD